MVSFPLSTRISLIKSETVSEYSRMAPIYLQVRPDEALRMIYVIGWMLRLRTKSAFPHYGGAVYGLSALPDVVGVLKVKPCHCSKSNHLPVQFDWLFSHTFAFIHTRHCRYVWFASPALSSSAPQHLLLPRGTSRCHDGTRGCTAPLRSTTGSSPCSLCSARTRLEPHRPRPAVVTTLSLYQLRARCLKQRWGWG